MNERLLILALLNAAKNRGWTVSETDFGATVNTNGQNENFTKWSSKNGIPREYTGGDNYRIEL